MKNLFRDMLDSVGLHDLMQSFFDVTGIPCGILDMEGTMLASVGRQRICKSFHRKNPHTLSGCLESNRRLFSSLSADEPYRIHECNHGLIDVAAPLFVAGQQVGIILLGQFFFAEPDQEKFRKQARRYGFAETEYMEALQAVPVYSRKKVDDIMNYYAKFGTILARLAVERGRFLEAQKLSWLDGLTGIANRRYFDQYFEQVSSAAARTRAWLALIMLDVDWFKQYNDAQGHLYGDDCLKVIASLLRSEIKRNGDFVARYGGEEFAIVLPSTDEKGALAVAERIRGKMAMLKMEHAESPFGYVTLSMGIAALPVNAEPSAMRLIDAADKALYDAKQEGRDRIKTYSSLTEVMKLYRNG